MPIIYFNQKRNFVKHVVNYLKEPKKVFRSDVISISFAAITRQCPINESIVVFIISFLLAHDVIQSCGFVNNIIMSLKKYFF